MIVVCENVSGIAVSTTALFITTPRTARKKFIF